MTRQKKKDNLIIGSRIEDLAHMVVQNKKNDPPERKINQPYDPEWHEAKRHVNELSDDYAKVMIEELTKDKQRTSDWRVTLKVKDGVNAITEVRLDPPAPGMELILSIVESKTTDNTRAVYLLMDSKRNLAYERVIRPK